MIINVCPNSVSIVKEVRDTSLFVQGFDVDELEFIVSKLTTS